MDKKNLDINVNVNVPKSVDNAISNLTDKPSFSLGKGLSDLLDLAFGRFKYLKEKQQLKYAAKLDAFRNELEAKTNAIPPEKLIEPNFQITGAAVEASKYCLESDDLREMFSNLIANSMNSDYITEIHPSFAEIIKQLSPLDAQNLALFKNNDFGIVEYRLRYKNENGELEKGFSVLQTNVFVGNINESNIDLQAASLSNLARLGLIKLNYESYYTNNEIYLGFYDTDFYKEHVEAGFNIELQKGQATKTPLGNSFIKVCVS